MIYNLNNDIFWAPAKHLVTLYWSSKYKENNSLKTFKILRGGQTGDYLMKPTFLIKSNMNRLKKKKEKSQKKVPFPVFSQENL